MAKKNKNNNLYDPVTITLFKDEESYSSDLEVIINGKVFVIKRGMPVTVPRYVSLAINQSAAQRKAAQKLIKETKRV